MPIPESGSAAGEPEIVRLNKTALVALEGLKRQGEFVFYTQHGKRLKSIRRSWYALLVSRRLITFSCHSEGTERPKNLVKGKAGVKRMVGVATLPG